MLHGPEHSSEGCIILREYSKKGVAQQPFKYKEARSSGNKRDKTIKFEQAAEEANIMKSQDELITRKKNVKRKN